MGLKSSVGLHASRWSARTADLWCVGHKGRTPARTRPWVPHSDATGRGGARLVEVVPCRRVDHGDACPEENARVAPRPRTPLDAVLRRDATRLALPARPQESAKRLPKHLLCSCSKAPKHIRQLTEILKRVTFIHGSRQQPACTVYIITKQLACSTRPELDCSHSQYTLVPLP